ncbi:hypothetical protein ICN84_05330 [Akkermansia glycaniphila]|uniref:hypothetical protein n=1 Tax=Akkermansia glycaniphila TaxID=1679444 RepID=UPI001C0320A4|nr:hypothetical protein [Akkermansia glycaniphila]MBT9449496.1 hypothetical protein [Akkermansia glycaniphila]
MILDQSLACGQGDGAIPIPCREIGLKSKKHIYTLPWYVRTSLGKSVLVGYLVTDEEKVIQNSVRYLGMSLSGIFRTFAQGIVTAAGLYDPLKIPAPGRIGKPITIMQPIRDIASDRYRFPIFRNYPGD